MKEAFDELSGFSIWKTSLSGHFVHSGGEGEFIDHYQNSLASLRVVKNESVSATVYKRSNNDYSIDFCIKTNNVKLIDGIIDRSDKIFFQKTEKIEPDFVVFVEN